MRGSTRSGLSLLLLLPLMVTLQAAEDKPEPIRPEEARKYVGKKVEVTFEVRASKNAILRTTVYLDSEKDFRDEKNLGVALTEKAVEELKLKRNIPSPHEFYLGKRIRVTGVVALDEKRPFIRVSSADQLDLAETGK